MLDSELYFGLFDLAISSVTIVDIDDPRHPIIFSNQAFSDLTGYASSEILGLNCKFLQSGATNPRAIEAMRHSIQTKQEGAFIVENRRKNGQRFHSFVSLSFFNAPSGKNICLGVQYDTRTENYPADVLDDLERYHGDAQMLMSNGTNPNFASRLKAQRMSAEAVRMMFYTAIRQANMNYRLAVAV